MKSPQLSARDVERGLRLHGFEEKPGTGTSHVKWVKIHNGEKLTVTVDAHLEPFSEILVSSMAKQAGMNKKQFQRMCAKQGIKDARKGVFAWFFGRTDAVDADLE